MIEHFLDNQLFQDLPVGGLQEIGDFSELVEYEDGQVIINENAKDNYDLFLLLEGNVEIVANSSQATSDEVVLSCDAKGILGEVSWLLKQKRTATVKSKGESIAIKIDGIKLEQFFNQHPGTGFIFFKKIASVLAARFQNTDNLLKQVIWNI